jgi:hypothetical protein
MGNEIKNKKDILNYDQKEPIRLLNWFFFITGIVLVLVTTYKIGTTNIVVDLTRFDFNALLSLLLSIFAIWLSVAFYFKATDTSNLFYDNTYKFTKEISEILGRIEAGFGERLRHLDEWYSGLMTKFDNWGQERVTQEKIEEEQLKLRQEIQERNNILNKVIEQSQLQQHEKEQIRRQLKDKEKEIQEKNLEISTLKNKLETESENTVDILEGLSTQVLKFLINYIRKNDIWGRISKLPISISVRRFKIDIENLDAVVSSHLVNAGIINIEESKFTLNGIRVLREIARRIK